MQSKWFAAIAATVAGAVLTAPATAQDKYPSKFVKVITTTGTGTAPDVVLRLVMDHLSRDWGQQLVVENNSTGGGLVATQQAQAAQADGYTLLSASSSAFVVLPVRQEKAPVQIGTHLKPIAFLGELPLAIAVSKRLPVSTLKELVDLTKKEPQRIFYAANATGTLPHMTGEMFKQKAGASITFVPYRGASEGLKDVLAGQIDLMIESYAGIDGNVKSGDLKVLAFTSLKRLPNFPEIPTVSELVPGFAGVGWAALCAPAGVSDEIVAKINADVTRILAQPALNNRLIELGAYTIPMTPTELREYIVKDQNQWRPLVQDILQQAAQKK